MEGGGRDLHDHLLSMIILSLILNIVIVHMNFGKYEESDYGLDLDLLTILY